jgi:hypothetical protein
MKMGANYFHRQTSDPYHRKRNYRHWHTSFFLLPNDIFRFQIGQPVVEPELYKPSNASSEIGRQAMPKLWKKPFYAVSVSHNSGDTLARCHPNITRSVKEYELNLTRFRPHRRSHHT